MDNKLMGLAKSAIAKGGKVKSVKLKPDKLKVKFQKPSKGKMNKAAEKMFFK